MSDDRLRQLLDNGFTCATCGEHHSGLFDIAFDHPDPWTGSVEKEPNGDVRFALEEGRDILSEDFCLMGEHRFVRAILPLKLIGTDDSFAFGVWGTLSQTRFLEYAEIFDAPNGSRMSPAFSWLSNRLPRAGPDPIRAQLHPQDNRQRPNLEIGDEDHPFFQAQSGGLSCDDLLAIYENYGHSPLLN
ncbi:DUF2199 domain-containing protein [Tabrizicola sp.]|uniref:DUF2199 domain-containing protein n=1 Tax=Tabrizicola sp. TaxID=2005166 RepID=UPI00286B383A|nr:DUF2199 domain-containing protein [Tabrizicola sp.]